MSDPLVTPTPPVNPHHSRPAERIEPAELYAEPTRPAGESVRETIRAYLVG
jgi:hypothetical protein